MKWLWIGLGIVVVIIVILLIVRYIKSSSVPIIKITRYNQNEKTVTISSGDIISSTLNYMNSSGGSGSSINRYWLLETKYLGNGKIKFDLYKTELQQPGRTPEYSKIIDFSIDSPNIITFR